jgi:DNA-binding MurR/RpiR family transcriptional regulator
MLCNIRFMPGDAPVAEQVRLMLPSLPRAERRVAMTLLEDYPAAGLETVASLATRAGTSGPTVLRLAARLGFTGFAELQQALRDELTDRHASPLAQYGKRDGAAAGSRAGEVKPELVKTAGGVLLHGIESSFGRLNWHHVERSIGLLADQRRPVVTAGGRFSGLLARYLALHLQELRPGVTWVGELERMGTLLDIGRRHVVVVFDFRRYQRDTVRLGRAAARQGATLLLATDPWLSPLAADADLILPVEVEAPSPFDSLVPAMALVEMLVAGVVNALGDQPRERIARYDRLWRDDAFEYAPSE